MKKTPDEFRAQAVKHKIKEWYLRDCSICGSALYYYFFKYRNHEVMYDPRCDCVSRGSEEPRYWKDVANHYNLQDNANVIAEMDKFWHFNEPKLVENGDTNNSSQSNNSQS